MTQTSFFQNIELDAHLVLAAMRGGIDGYMNACFLRRELFPDTDTAMKRAEWFKKQDKQYLDKVTARIVELEKE